MQPFKIEVPGSNPLRKDLFVCTAFAVNLATQRIVPTLHVEQYQRTSEAAPWVQLRKYHASGQYPVVTESDNSKFVNAAFEVVSEEYEGAIGEVDAIWMQHGALIEGIISTLMTRMIDRGNLNDLSTIQ